MINEKENKRISKFLSLVLRHKPEAAGIELDAHGWTDASILIEKMREHGFEVTHGILQHVVSTNDKSRFAFSDDHRKIRASQGHSVEIDLGYKTQQPPPVLYHGTSENALASILKTGLEKRGRHHVHLSSDKKTALAVGQRYGEPVLLQVSALKMFSDGYEFYLADNGVWLTDHVPVRYFVVGG